MISRHRSSCHLPRPAGALHARLTRTAAGVVVIETGGIEVEVVLHEWLMPIVRGRQRGTRTRFACPRCDASRDVLHWVDGEWGCRGCFKLSHASRHQQRWCPAIRRRVRLLRKLARVPPRSLKARMLRVQIAHQQAAMLADVKWANRALEKRSRRHARRSRVNPE